MSEHAILRAHLAGRVGSLSLEVDLQARSAPLVLVGPNGAGKTTLLLMLLGVRRPQRGRIEVGGHVLFDSASRRDVPVEHRRLGYVPQDYALFGHLSVRENVAFALASAAPKDARPVREARIDAVLDALGLHTLGERGTASLSGGEKQRVALARALSVDPWALLLDEPLAALDAHARRDVRATLAATLRALARPTVVVTHDPEDARALGGPLCVLEGGRIVQTGAWEELEARPATAFVEEFVSEPRAAGARAARVAAGRSQGKSTS